MKNLFTFAKQSESGIDRNHKNSIPYVPKLIPLDFVGDIF